MDFLAVRKAFYTKSSCINQLCYAILNASSSLGCVRWLLRQMPSGGMGGRGKGEGFDAVSTGLGRRGPRHRQRHAPSPLPNHSFDVISLTGLYMAPSLVNSALSAQIFAPLTSVGSQRQLHVSYVDPAMVSMVTDPPNTPFYLFLYNPWR